MKQYLILSFLLVVSAGCGSQSEGISAPGDDSGAGSGGSGGTDTTDAAGGSGAGGSGGAGGVGGTGGDIDAGSADGGSSPICSSQAHWTNGDRGSQLMHPGGACITCHSANTKAPKLAIAGTIYPTSHEQNDCNGVNGTGKITVVVTDATGKDLSPIAVNNVGNFYYQGTIASPFKVKIVANGKENAMMENPPVGDCNSCHTQEGANNAPGRILAPQ